MWMIRKVFSSCGFVGLEVIVCRIACTPGRASFITDSGTVFIAVSGVERVRSVRGAIASFLAK